MSEGLGLEKHQSWTWKSDIKYYFLLPFQLVKYLILYVLDYSKISEEFSLREWLGLARAQLDVQCGRVYIRKGIKEKEEKESEVSDGW